MCRLRDSPLFLRHQGREVSEPGGITDPKWLEGMQDGVDGGEDAKGTCQTL